MLPPLPHGISGRLTPSLSFAMIQQIFLNLRQSVFTEMSLITPLWKQSYCLPVSSGPVGGPPLV